MHPSTLAVSIPQVIYFFPVTSTSSTLPSVASLLIACHAHITSILTAPSWSETDKNKTYIFLWVGGGLKGKNGPKSLKTLRKGGTCEVGRCLNPLKTLNFPGTWIFGPPRFWNWLFRHSILYGIKVEWNRSNSPSEICGTSSAGLLM